MIDDPSATIGPPPGESLSNPEPANTPPNRKLVQLVAGLSGGGLCGWLISEMFMYSDRSRYMVLGCAIVFGILNLTRLRRLVFSFTALCAAMILMVGFTPLVPWLLGSEIRTDALRHVDAVVSLGGGLNGDGTLGHLTQDRVLHAMALVHAGYAPRLVLTGGEELGLSVVRRQGRALGLDLEIVDAGPAKNTHDEGVAVAQLIKQRGWGPVILVTHGWHMKRAAATFEKSGVQVLCSPCPDSEVDMHNPSRLHDRMRALASWLHEAIGYKVYQLRGWI
jgi:uncharacterized SAM-binding protein YcdF (DUF218 family)